MSIAHDDLSTIDDYTGGDADAGDDLLFRLLGRFISPEHDHHMTAAQAGLWPHRNYADYAALAAEVADELERRGALVPTIYAPEARRR